MQNYEFSYDKETDDLLLYNPNSKSKGSVELGDLVLDYDSKKQLVGIQIMNASEFLSDLAKDTDSKMIKEVLGCLSKCKVEMKLRKGINIVHIFLFSKIKDLNPVISLPELIQSSPALAYA